MGKIKKFPPSGGTMYEQAIPAIIQVETTAESRPSVPAWFGEITLLA
jgi:hypothetical protein